MTRLILCCILSGWFFQGYSQSVNYPIDASHSVISFSVGFAGGITSIDGRFDRFEGKLGYVDPNDPTTFFAKVVIDVNSINTGDDQRDEDLKRAGFFNVEAFPKITFESTKTTKLSDGFSITGTFSMLGKETSMEIPFRFNHDPAIVWVFGEPRIAVQGVCRIDRLEYNIPKRGWDNLVPSLGSMTLSRNVVIKLLVHGVGPSLSALLQEKIAESGVDAAIELYEQLEKKEGGKGTYTFGDRSLVGVIMELAQHGKNGEAVQVGEFATSRYQDSFRSWYGLAIAQQAVGNKEAAVRCFEKTLELNPDFSRAAAALKKLKE